MHGRVTNNLFSPLIEKIDKRLEGWKTKFLSTAGRQVLVKSTLSSIPYYAMQTTLLPVGICDRIDRKIRGFLWGSNGNKRKCHLVRWDLVTRSKDEGGLGIRTSRDMNLAFLGKMGWRVLKEKDRLWTEVLRQKYANGSTCIDSLTAKKGSSNLWRGITTALPLIKEGIRYHIQSGRQARFWEDYWLDDKPLKERINHGEGWDREAKVADLWSADTRWKREMLHNKLPDEVFDKLNLITITNQEEAQDEIAWRMESSGMYSVSSAYHLIKRNISVVQDRKWEKMWKLKVLNKMKMLLRTIMHGKVLCNVEWKRRGLTGDDKCSSCGNEVETINHIFRSCEKASTIWHALLPNNDTNRLNGMVFNDWIMANLEGKISRSDKRDWPNSFAVSLWWIWRWRNDRAFNNKEIDKKK